MIERVTSNEPDFLDWVEAFRQQMAARCLLLIWLLARCER